VDSQEYLAAPVVVAAPAGVDATTATQLRTALLAVDGRCPAVVVDMSRTVFCDMAGISVLAQARNWAMAGSSEVRLVITSVSVLRIFALTGYDRLFPTGPGRLRHRSNWEPADGQPGKAVLAVALAIVPGWLPAGRTCFSLTVSCPGCRPHRTPGSGCRHCIPRARGFWLAHR
jgi:anti-sigma B factor antagonist